MKKIKILLVILALTIVIASCLDFESLEDVFNSTVTTTVDGLLTVHYIDVDQADAILIQNNNEAMLIDAGNPKDADTVIEYIKQQGITALKYVVATHPHNDHIGGMASVIEEFDIENMIMPAATHTTKAFERLMDQIEKKGLKIQSPEVLDIIQLGDAQFTVCAPNSAEYQDLNDYSIVLQGWFGGTSFLFTGDAESLSEKEILGNGIDLQSDVLKVGHHGSRTSSSKDFLDAVSPSIAVISCGKDNDYGHPHQEILEELNKRNINILRTDELGNIIIQSDGTEISIN